MPGQSLLLMLSYSSLFLSQSLLESMIGCLDNSLQLDTEYKIVFSVENTIILFAMEICTEEELVFLQM